jgi:hypothetical protein
MGDTLDLNRRWTLAEAAAELWARGVSVKSHADGYHLNYAKGGTTRTEFVTDDLIEALTVGFEMAEHKPALRRPIRRRRPPTRKAKIRSHNRALARRQWKKKSKAI